jgi:hypothetical protein
LCETEGKTRFTGFLGRRAAEDKKDWLPKRIFDTELDYTQQNSWIREYAKAKVGFDFRGLETWKETLTKVQIARGIKPTAKPTAGPRADLSPTASATTSSTSSTAASNVSILVSSTPKSVSKSESSKKARKCRAETPSDDDEWEDALRDDEYQPPTTRSGRVTKRPR